MTTTQIRFTAPKQMKVALEELKERFKFLSEAEIFKLAFSRFYNEEMGFDANGFSLSEQKEIRAALLDTDIEGPFDTGEAFISSLKA